MATEYDEQVVLIEWLNLKNIFHFAVVNENQQSKSNKLAAIKIAQKHKKAGRAKGTSDVFIFLPHKLLAIELKSAPRSLKSGKLSTSHTSTSKEQIEFIDRVKKFDYADAKVCYGFNQAKEFIESHISFNIS